MVRQRVMAIGALSVAAVAAFVITTLSLNVLRVDACLDLGGSWRREAEACFHDGILIRSAYPTWVYGLTGGTSIVVLIAACVSFVAACMRRWDLARRVGGRSFVAGLAILVTAFALATGSVTFD